MKDVVPLGMSGVGVERELRHDCVGDGDSSRVGVEIQSGGDCQPGSWYSLRRSG